MKNNNGFNIVSIVILVSIIVLIGLVSWRVWEATAVNQASKDHTNSIQSPPDKTSQNSNGLSSQDMFSIAELGVRFAVKNSEQPLYKITNLSANGVNFQDVSISTRQMEDTGKAQSKSCGIDQFALIDMYVFGSKADALALEGQSNTNLTIDDITPSNGFLAVNNKIFSIPQGVRAGTGICVDGAFESQERTALRESLMTLQPN